MQVLHQRSTSVDLGSYCDKNKFPILVCCVAYLKLSTAAPVTWKTKHSGKWHYVLSKECMTILKTKRTESMVGCEFDLCVDRQRQRVLFVCIGSGTMWFYGPELNWARRERFKRFHALIPAPAPCLYTLFCTFTFTSRLSSLVCNEFAV